MRPPRKIQSASCLNPLSAIPEATEACFDLEAQSLPGEEIIPDFWIMKSQAQNKRQRGAAGGGTRTLWVFSLVTYFANER